MIKSLYVRVVITFIAVVMLSLTIAFMISSPLFKNKITNYVQVRMLEVGLEIVEMEGDLNPPDLDFFMKGISKLSTNFGYYLYKDDGTLLGNYSELEKKDYIFEQKEISYVLNGNTYKSFNYKRSVDSQVVVGVPFTNQGQRYALFLTPEFVDGVSIFTDVTRTILLIVLALGSLFILIASGYIVKPLRKLTEATQRLAQGDFDVHVAVKKKDELGTLAASFNHMAQELKQLERMRQNFVSNVSHEIQTPLTSIRGFSKVLRDPKLSEVERLHYLNIIETESERLSRLSDNLLKLASLESEHHPFHRSEISLDEQLRKIVVACEPLWSAKDLTLELDLTKTVLLGDEDQLSQVWTNLLHNCVKFTPHGGIIRIDIQQKMNAVEVIFQDNGIGISVEEQERIFQRFYKADASRQSIPGGNGLGLAIVKKIVDIHRGSVSVTSVPGQGSTFTVYLPFIR